MQKFHQRAMSIIQPFFDVFINADAWASLYYLCDPREKALCVKYHAQSLCSLKDIREKPFWKLENVVTTFYTCKPLKKSFGETFFTDQ